ncbi:uncharacterized protein LOC127804272 [Diospyros lotus]|uniref:uncharacterized protein LOC127804272 n=1 Tax=Diospyros lotus TaxID=55363 RepID=UPI002254443C|nr:uncharacterized protein LOC127804272 [Diospyros lotus]
MPQRNHSREQPYSDTNLRRSPRFFSNSRPTPEDPKTPGTKSRINSVLSDSRTLGPARNCSLKNTQRRCPEKVPKKGEDSKYGSKTFEKLETGSESSARLIPGVCLQRSPRFSGKANSLDKFVGEKSSNQSDREGLLNFNDAEVRTDPDKGVVAITEKRVTRSSGRANGDECVEKAKNNKGSRFIKKASVNVSDKENLPDVERIKVCCAGNSGKHLGVKLERRVTRSYGANIDKSNEFIKSDFREASGEKDILVEERAKVCPSSGKKFGGKLEKRLKHTDRASSLVVDGVKEKKGDIDKGIEVIGVKRKRSQVQAGQEIGQGWTKDQELALQRAYFAVKPTPHFWKKVAKLVPGKSAQDCFDKLHADHLTPPQPQNRSSSRTTRTNSASFSFSTSTLIKPAEPKTRKPTSRKPKSHILQKTVRQLLEKHYDVDQDHEADLFSVLESTSDPTAQPLEPGVLISTPVREEEKPGCSKIWTQKSLSAHKKPVSRLCSSGGATLVSPPVLKLIKNRALHEKYIDQLHCREAKRRAASARAGKLTPGGKENRKASYVQKTDAIRAAKNALVFEARDAMHQFRHLEAIATSKYSNSDDDSIEREDYEDER